MSAPNVVGLDLSIAATGICSQPYDEVETGTFKLAAKLGDQRLDIIAGAIEQTPADLYVIEDLPTHAHGAGITGMVHGAVRVALMRMEVPYALVTPATLKKYATGKGNAGKPEMAVALYKRTGLELADDNQVDAWWLRCAGLDALGHAPVELPESQRAALSKVEWPAVVS